MALGWQCVRAAGVARAAMPPEAAKGAEGCLEANADVRLVRNICGFREIALELRVASPLVVVITSPGAGLRGLATLEGD
eukprot:2060853-Pleurochrysis_carterae.AAC.1